MQMFLFHAQLTTMAEWSELEHSCSIGRQRALPSGRCWATLELCSHTYIFLYIYIHIYAYMYMSAWGLYVLGRTFCKCNWKFAKKMVKVFSALVFYNRHCRQLQVGSCNFNFAERAHSAQWSPNSPEHTKRNNNSNNNKMARTTPTVTFDLIFHVSSTNLP